MFHSARTDTVDGPLSVYVFCYCAGATVLVMRQPHANRMCFVSFPSFDECCFPTRPSICRGALLRNGQMSTASCPTAVKGFYFLPGNTLFNTSLSKIN